MTKHQVERATDVLNNLVVAVVGTRSGLDAAGLLLAVFCFGLSQRLTRLIGRPNL